MTWLPCRRGACPRGDRDSLTGAPRTPPRQTTHRSRDRASRGRRPGPEPCNGDGSAEPGDDRMRLGRRGDRILEVGLGIEPLLHFGALAVEDLEGLGGEGGGIGVDNGTPGKVAIVDSTVSNNQAATGGGIYFGNKLKIYK